MKVKDDPENKLPIMTKSPNDALSNIKSEYSEMESSSSLNSLKKTEILTQEETENAAQSFQKLIKINSQIPIYLSRIETLSKQLKEVETEKSFKEKDLDMVKKENFSLKESLKLKEKEINTLKEELVLTERVNQGLLGANQRLEENLEKFKEETEQIKEKCKNTEECQNELINKQNNEINELIYIKSQQDDLIKQKTDDLEWMEASHNEKLKEMTKTNDLMDKRLIDVTKRYNELQKSYNCIGIQIEELQKSFKNIDTNTRYVNSTTTRNQQTKKSSRNDESTSTSTSSSSKNHLYNNSPDRKRPKTNSFESIATRFDQPPKVSSQSNSNTTITLIKFNS